MDKVETYLTQLVEVVGEMPRDQIWNVVYALVDAWQRKARVFLLGDGSSAATASHMAYSLNRRTIVPDQPRFKAIAVTDNIPFVAAWDSETAYEDIFVEQLLNFVEPRDVVIAISAGGSSPNVVKALQVAQEHDAVTVAFTGPDGGQLEQLVDHCISVPSDHVGQQEDAHMILDHVIASTLRQLIEEQAEERETIQDVWGPGATWD